MTWLLARHRVKDYDTFKSVFDGKRDELASAGAGGGYIMRDPDDPNLISVAVSFDDVDSLRAFHAKCGGPDSADLLARAGVIGEPEAYQFDVVEQLSFAPAEVLAA